MENIDPRLDALIDAYIDHSIDDASFEMLCAWLREYPDNRRAFARKLSMHSAIAEWCTERSGGVLATTQAEPEEAETTSWIDELTSLAEQAETNASPQLASLAGYALRIALTSKLAYQAYAVAAVLLLGVTLLFVFTGNDDPANPTSDLTATPSEPNSEPGPLGPAPTNTFVATLTAEHDAVWKQPGGDHRPGALRPGTHLSAGQRLELTQGFAEITTNDGAIAIIEAPATIQLINHNAIRLHAGKLVGICETDASKGFVVRTPHMDVTDLGTRFGISADADATEVHVFEGKVQAEKVDAAPGTEPTLLVADQSARTSADTDVIARIDHRTDRFAALLPTTTQLPGTGHGLAVGEADPNWQIVAIDGQALDQPQLASVSGLPIYTDPIPNDPQRSQWLMWNPGRDDAAIYTFRTTVELPEGVDPTARIDVRCVADNQLRAIIVNGHRIERESGPIGTAWIYREARLQEHLRPGENTIEFEVANIVVGGRPAGELALKVQWQLTTTPGLRNTEQSRPQ